jgi:hypothetical protein
MLAPRSRGAAPPPPPVSRSTAALLRRVLHARREGWLLVGRLEHVADAAVADARRERASASQLVRALRRAWALVPDVHAVHPQDARDLLNHLVTACVHSYYGRHYDEARDGAVAPTGGP